MLQLETQSQPSPMSQPTTTAILVIGGAEDKVHGKEILHTFWFRSGGTNATIAIIPSASREPVLIGERYQSIFEEMGAKYVKVLDIRDRDQGNDPYFKEYVEECTGVFMTGGDQLRLCGLLADTPLMERIRQRVQLGEISLGGTSAGAAVMGHHMIAGGSSGESPNRALVDMAMGLGIIPEIIVDQHFHNRNRMSRLLSALSTHPERLGIGIDEDTCALFERDGLMRIVGKGTVTIVDGRDMSYTNQADISATEPLSLHNLRVNILSHGDCYHLHQHQCIAKISSPVQ
ncbi:MULTISPECIES: cyanophycinase [Crocosphaera]|uniref:Cyanophycinase n=3 Tax=Crocosphaera watsonii TaxID=263511 RepID=T2JNS5_CROWT|nr:MULTISPECIES: cyanophycinase [Crocosphaera]EHJ12424.1 Cyanophycinase [Crocosphaera watsonii WH 0003]MCH2246394.1 cyanophycinase [Crocosphaera sp.]CCQ56219.1 Cyanophycinase [Crocosphaera watsonii WH 0005]CCQ67543.1 Cyanophycinase [Crocosphaera watsonii WH 0402]